MWIALIIIGTFIRGPGWYLFLPGQYWDVHKTVAITNVTSPTSSAFHDAPCHAVGAGCLLVWLIVIPMRFWKARIKKERDPAEARDGALSDHGAAFHDLLARS